jgi:hypothetical protein
MRIIYLINLFIICCHSFIHSPTPHNSNKISTIKTCFTHKLKRISSSLVLTSCKKNNDDNNNDELFNKLIINILYNYILYIYIYYYLYEHYNHK